MNKKNVNNHTPGPWDAIQDLGGHPRSWRVEPHTSSSRLATNLKEEDACLIAAAPEMLEVLEDSWPVIAALCNGNKPDKWVMKSIEQKMVDAIAKAKGAS